MKFDLRARRAAGGAHAGGHHGGSGVPFERLACQIARDPETDGRTSPVDATGDARASVTKPRGSETWVLFGNRGDAPANLSARRIDVRDGLSSGSSPTRSGECSLPRAIVCRVRELARQVGVGTRSPTIDPRSRNAKREKVRDNFESEDVRMCSSHKKRHHVLCVLFRVTLHMTSNNMLECVNVRFFSLATSRRPDEQRSDASSP